MKRFLTFFFVVFLLTSFIQISSSQEEQESYVDVSLNKKYGLINEILYLDVKVSYVGFNLKVYYPNNTLAYDNDFTGSERTLPITVQKPYGYYKVEVAIPELKSTLYFTSLDVEDFELAEMPYELNHKGVNYKFRKDWILEANSLEVDFHFIRDLIDKYDLDFVVLKNSMNVVVRLRKSDVFKCDIVFSFIYHGCKFSINGTQDKIREFTINLLYAKRFLDSFRKGNTVFDYSDIPKGSYLEHGSAVTITVSKVFNIDPVIFEDGFETGDYSAWTATVGNPDVVGSPVHHGSYSSRGNASAEYPYKTVADQTQFNLRSYVRVDALPSVNAQTATLLRGESDANFVFTMELTQDAGVDKWKFKSRQAGATNTKYSTTDVMGVDAWVCIEVQVIFSTADGNLDGSYRVYIDGTENMDLQSLNVDTDRVMGNKGFAGQIWSNYAVNTYHDCVIIDSSYIGVEGDNNPPVWSSLSESSTLAGNSSIMSSYWYDIIGNMSHYIFNTNNTGSYVNDSAVAFNPVNNTWARVTKTLNSTVGITVCWRVYGNDTSNNWNTTDLRCFVTTQEDIEFSNLYVLTAIGIFTICLSFIGLMGRKAIFPIMALFISLLVFIPIPVLTPTYFISFQVAVVAINVFMVLASYDRS